jgi:hypothetical protein
MSDSTIFTLEQKKKLEQLFKEGISVMSEVQILNEGLADTIKAIAEEMEVKPGVLKKAVRTAYKVNFQQAVDDHELLETILETVGRTD